AMKRTASLPSRRPKTPFTKAPRSGMSRTTAMSEKSFAGKRWRKGFIRLVLQEIGFVRADGAPDAEQREHDGEAYGDLRRLRGDDEEGEGLTGLRVHRRTLAVERDEREVDRVQHDLDAHQRDEHVAANEKPDATDGEQ